MKSEERRAGATTAADAGADSGGDGSCDCCDELEGVGFGIAVGGGEGLRPSSRSDVDVMRGDTVCFGADEDGELLANLSGCVGWLLNVCCGDCGGG